MKRIALAILLVTVVAASAFAVLNRPDAQASPDATIIVDSTEDTNSRDFKLTLREAMLLATGGLAVGDLDAGEADHVLGTPGAAEADTIVFDPAFFEPRNPATITLGSSLPSLHTGDDTVDGSSSGVVIECASTSIVAFEVASDSNTIKGLEIYGCNIGIVIIGGDHNTVGGSGPGERNVISGNQLGIDIETANANVVIGNYIGTDASGTAAVPNSWGIGFAMDAANNIVGGTGPGEGNLIAFNTSDGVGLSGGVGGGPRGNTIQGNLIHSNGGDGVLVGGPSSWPSIGNTIRLNSIHSNGGKGIHNRDGGNTELEPPTVQSAGSVFGTACPNCTIDIYSDQDDEGEIYEGSTTADGDGNWGFPGVPHGPNITATATDSAGNTSEFSAPLLPPWPTPVPTTTPTVTATSTATPSHTPEGDTDGDTVPDDVEGAHGSDPHNPESTPESLGYDPSTCTDGIDNDADGFTDGEDEGCLAGPTRTLTWGPGWHNETWTGASTPEEAFACAAGNYAAAYRLVSGGWERYFPDRPDISNMSSLEQYDAFLILVTADVTCQMDVADLPAGERLLDWGVGWHNDGWTGPDGTPPLDAFSCAAGDYAAAYRYVDGGLERYFPDRPEISNMGALDKYDAFLILVTAPVSCSMPIAP